MVQPLPRKGGVQCAAYWLEARPTRCHDAAPGCMTLLAGVFNLTLP